jgi:hypothetical protein
MSADISGRVLDLEKQVVGLPGRYDYDNLNSSIASRFNVVNDYVGELQRQFIELNNKIVNLQLVGNTGSSGTGNHSHVWNEIPAGNINGINASFTLSGTPNPSRSLFLFKNGLAQTAGSGNDYTLAGNIITFQSGNVPESGTNLLASYTV